MADHKAASAKLESMSVIQSAILDKAKEMNLDSSKQDSDNNYMEALEIFEHMIRNRASLASNLRKGSNKNRLFKTRNYAIGIGEENSITSTQPVVKAMLNKAFILKHTHDGSENRGKRNVSMKSNALFGNKILIIRHFGTELLPAIKELSQ